MLIKGAGSPAKISQGVLIRSENKKSLLHRLNLRPVNKISTTNPL